VDRLGTGVYLVGFPRDVAACVPTAIIGGVPVGPGFSAPVPNGFVRVDMPGTGPATVLGHQEGTFALVSTFFISGGVTTGTDSSFFLAMLC
jgi:hypothetical protein